MFDIIPIKKHIKLMAKTEYIWSENRIAVSKVSPTLSQQNIFESNLVDDYLDKFFLKITFNGFYVKKFYDFKVPIVVNVYKKKNKSDIIVLNPSMVMILKRFLDRRKFNLKGDYSRLNFYEIEILKINILRYLFYTLDFSFLVFKKGLPFFGGLLNSLKFRNLMKSRKINFRRKIRRDSEGNIINK